MDNIITWINFSILDNFNRTGFILGRENWDRYDFKAF